MKIKTYSFILLLFALIGVYGCTKDYYPNSGAEGTTSLSFLMQAPNSLNYKPTDALDTSHFKVLIFNKENNTPKRLGFISNSNNLTVQSLAETGKYQINLKIPKNFKGDFHGVILMNQENTT